MKINPNLSGIGNVLELINAANPNKNFTSLEVAVKSVTPRTPDSIPYNSAAVLMGKPDSQYKDEQTVYYNRRPILEAVQTPTVSYAVDETTTMDELLAMVCSALRIVKTDVELVDFRTPQDSSVSFMTLKPIENALLYHDTFDITLVWVGEGVQEAVSVLWLADELDKFINVTVPSRGY